MAIETLVYEALATDAGLKRVLDGKIFPVRVPQGTILPVLVYYRISGVPHNHIGAGYGISRVRIRLDVWALNYADAKDIAEAVKTAVAVASGFEKIIENSGPDWGDDKTFRTSIDIICWEKEGHCYG